jgi:hypothetical protein
MDPHLVEMEKIAREYCGLIESVDQADSSWLEQMEALLPKLHAAVSALGAPLTERHDHSLAPDLDARFELFVELRRLLGQRDGYWMEFDGGQDAHSMTGSLADDLTDIYCELKHGLGLLDNEPERALDDWRSGYKVHWGQHLLDAERHLYKLRSHDQL